MPGLHSHTRYYSIIPIVTILLLAGCRIAPKETREKDLLVKNKIEGNEEFSNDELSNLYKQKPNKKILGFVSSRSAYYLGKKKKWLFFDVWNVEKLEKKIRKIENKYDAKIAKADAKKDSVRLVKKKNERIAQKRLKIKEGSWLARSVGEKPAVIDTTKIHKTEDQMTSYMQSKGYFDAQVTSTIEPRFKGNTTSRKKKVIYNVDEGEPTILRNITFSCEDDSIQFFLRASSENSKLVSGKPFDVSKIEEEKTRIYNGFRNHGYYYFKKQYIVFEADTTVGPKLMDIDVFIEIPTNAKLLNTFRIRDIYFRLEHPEDSDTRLDTTYDESSGIHYIKGHGKFSTKVLNKKIKIRSGDLFQLDKIVQSQNLLGNIDIFKYVNFNFKEVSDHELDIQVFASPFKKYQLSTEGGANINITRGTSLPGPFINVSFKDRNVFNGFEIFETSVRYSIEGQASATNENQFFNNREIGMNMGISMPKILFPHFLIPQKLENSMYSFNPRSKVSVGYTNVRRPEYTRNNLNAALNLSWQKTVTKSFIFTPLEVHVIDSDITSYNFLKYLFELENAGNNLIKSFQSSFVPSMSFSFLYNDNVLGNKKNAKFNRLNIEVGGLLLTTLKEAGTVEDEIFNLPYYQFFKISDDLRFYNNINPNTTFVTRIYGGIATPFGASQTLPYEKFFFSGGSNSMRAWEPRRLGPGSLPPYNEDRTNFDYSFEQPGEIVLEFNMEWRKKLIGFIDGALFIDAGNVWTFGVDNVCETCSDTERSARTGEFRFDKFYKEIAVGTGFGLRLNFSIIIVRFDVGLKVYDPARANGNKFIFLKKEDSEGIKNSPTLNLGIGYPF